MKIAKLPGLFLLMCVLLGGCAYRQSNCDLYGPIAEQKITAALHQLFSQEIFAARVYYPSSALAQGETGLVEVGIFTARGRLSHAVLHTSSGHQALDLQALSATQKFIREHSDLRLTRHHRYLAHGMDGILPVQFTYSEPAAGERRGAGNVPFRERPRGGVTLP